MELISTYPKTTSSGPNTKKGLSDPEKSPWSPDSDDDAPYVTVTVDDEVDEYISEVEISSTTNVASVTVVVVTKAGEEVNVLTKFTYIFCLPFSQ